MTPSISQDLLQSISYLDAFSEAGGMLSAKAREMTELCTDSAILEFLLALGECRKNIEYRKESKAVIKKSYDSLLTYLGRIKFNELKSQLDYVNNETESFDQLYNQLDNLIGLEKVKCVVNDLMAYHRIQKLRSKAGLKIPNRTLHLAFLGNPGTGKTTVARIVGKMYKQLGLLSKGHFIEVSRTDLIAGYQGQTALKVKQVIEKAKGGVLFIDEAYSLTENDHSDSYGRECLTELTKALEDYRKDLVVIVAGYTDLMNHFFESNPGLKSRFNTFIEFDNYESSELISIFEQMCINDDYLLTYNAKEKLSSLVEKGREHECEKFANGRYVRNLYEEVIMNQARRVNALSDIKDDDLRDITIEDFPQR